MAQHVPLLRLGQTGEPMEASPGGGGEGESESEGFSQRDRWK